jgi:hypothetical protein
MPEPTAHTPPISYEPPRIERVLTPEDLAREVDFAGKQVVTLVDF